MKLKDIDWDKLLGGPPKEEREAENEAFHQAWLETFGDTSKSATPDVLTRQGGGEGIYIANVDEQKTFSKIYHDIELLNKHSGAKIVSAPRDPSGGKTYVESEGKYFAVPDVGEFRSLAERTDGFNISAYSNGNIGMIFHTGQLYEKVGKRTEIPEDLKSNLEALFDGLRRFEVYEPLDDASLEEIFFNDTGIDYDPGKFNLEKVRDAAAIKDYFDFISDHNYTDEEDEGPRGGVDDIKYDISAGVAVVRYVSDSFGVTFNETSDINFAQYDEAMPQILRADAFMVTPYAHSDWTDLLEIDFYIGNIRRK